MHASLESELTPDICEATPCVNTHQTPCQRNVLQTANFICTHSKSQGKTLSSQGPSPATAKKGKCKGRKARGAAGLLVLNPGWVHPERPGMKGGCTLPLCPRLRQGVGACLGGGLIHSSPASALGLPQGQVPHLPKAPFQLQPEMEAPGLEGEEGSRALSAEP